MKRAEASDARLSLSGNESGLVSNDRVAKPPITHNYRAETAVSPSAVDSTLRGSAASMLPHSGRLPLWREGEKRIEKTYHLNKRTENTETGSLSVTLSSAQRGRGPAQRGEGPSSEREGPSSAREGPSLVREGPSSEREGPGIEGEELK